MAVADVYGQLEEQSWEVKQMVFSGMAQSAITVPGQGGVVPVFMFVCMKTLGENEKLDPPRIQAPKK